MGMPTRRELIQATLDQVRATGEPTVPWEGVPALSVGFEDLGDLLLTLHRRWYARFSARLDMLLEDPPTDIAVGVRELWEQLTAEDPAWRAVLDAYCEHPAVAEADERQRKLLATATAGEVPTLPTQMPQPAEPAA